MRSLIFILFVTFLLPFSAWSQVDPLSIKKGKTDCESSLALANDEFHEGRFFSLPSILKDCLAKGFTKEQKIRAYILLCQVYLITDNPAEAEASYLKLLTADPEYIATPELDPIDVVYLSRKFTTRPIFTPHVKLGINTSFVSLIHEVSSTGTPDRIRNSYGLKPGLSFGAGIDWNISDRIRFGLDLSFTNRRFQKSETGSFGQDENKQIIKLVWLDLPIFLKYQDYTGTFRPYGYVGYAFHFSLAAKGQYSSLNIDGSESGVGYQSPTEGPVVDLSAQQTKLNQSFVIGGGVRYKVGKNFLLADLRLQLGLTNVTNSSIVSNSTDSIDPNLILYNIVVDAQRINSITLSLGYVFPFYSPRKKGGWQPGGILGKILYGSNNITK